MKPLAIDLFCGLGGWAEGFLAEGFDVVGFDIERRPYPAQLVMQDARTIDGAQFKNAACIVASPPCQAYSYRAMPWKRAKALPPPDNALFETCWRIQREACAAAGRHIPLVVENVCGAQKWVGRAAWHYGSYYLWGDVPALMPFAMGRRMKSRISCNARRFDQRIASTPEEAHALHYRLPKDYGLKLRDADRYERNHPQAFGWKLPRTSSRSSARMAASAEIARIPFDLARHIAAVYKPREAA